MESLCEGGGRKVDCDCLAERIASERRFMSSLGGLGNDQDSVGEKGRTEIGEGKAISGIRPLPGFKVALSGTVTY